MKKCWPIRMDFLFSLGLAFSLWTAYPVGFPNQDVSEKTVQLVLQQLREGDRATRKSAAYEILRNGEINHRPEVRRALVQELESQHAYVTSPSYKQQQGGDEDPESTYLGDLLEGVAKLRIAEALPFFHSIKAAHCLVYYGEEESLPVIQELSLSKNVIARIHAYGLLSDLFAQTKNPKPLSENGRLSGKEIMFRGLSDSEGSVRMMAVDGLALVADDDAERALANITSSDSVTAKFSPFLDSKLKERAREALDDIRIRRWAQSSGNPVAYQTYKILLKGTDESLMALADKYPRTILAARILVKVAQRQETHVQILKEQLKINQNIRENLRVKMEADVRDMPSRTEKLLEKVIEEYPRDLWPESLKNSPTALRMAAQRGKVLK